MSNLLDEEEAGRYLGGSKPVSVRTLQRMRQNGDGPAFLKLGAAVRYRPEDLDEFLTAARRSSTSEDRAAMPSRRRDRTKRKTPRRGSRR